MDRRRYLAVLAAAVGGCSTATPPTPAARGGVTRTAAGDITAPGTAAPARADGTRTPRESNEAGGYTNVDLPVESSDLHRGAPEDAIPAIVDPEFAADWSDYVLEYTRFGETTYTDLSLADGDEVIGVERGGEARAYPLRILNYHEVVNDTFDGPLLVTYCPLCGSGVTAVRRVDGAETTFGVSGLLWNSDLVMDDERTDSLWSQVLGRAIRGPETGTRLELVPSTLTTWGEWRETHPETRVLLPPPRSSTVTGPDSVRDYTENPYAGYEESPRIGIGYNDVSDFRLDAKVQVLGVRHDGVARAYPLPVVLEERVINDVVGGVPVLVAATPADRMVAYDRRVDGETLAFSGSGDPAFVTAGDSRWRVTTGRAVDGPHEGTELSAATERTAMFWFAWADFHPETGIYGVEGTPTGTADGP